jgi:hypothetical protein
VLVFPFATVGCFKALYSQKAAMKPEISLFSLLGPSFPKNPETTIDDCGFPS